MTGHRPLRANTPSLGAIYLAWAIFVAVVAAGLTLTWWWPL